MSEALVWGPASPLAIAMEKSFADGRERMRRDLERHLYGNAPLIITWTCPDYVLRNRAVYGGRKGRAAIKRLKVRGAKPIGLTPASGGDQAASSGSSSSE